MGWLIALGIVVVILALLLFMKVGAVVSYAADGFRVQIRVAFVRYTIYPKKEKPKEKKAPEKPKRKKSGAKQPEEQRGGDAGIFRELIRPFLEAASDTRRRITIDVLEIDYTAAAGDPAAAAIQYGSACAAVGALIGTLENVFRLGEREIRIGVDFDLKSPVIRFKASISLRFWQTLSVSLRFGLKFFGIYRKRRRARKTEQKTRKTQTAAS